MTVIGNGMLLTNNPQEPFIANGAVAVEGGTIAAVGSSTAIRERYPDAEFIDANGGLIMPGLIDAHSHMYRSFARGLKSPAREPRSVAEQKRLIWQRIDRELTLDDCIRCAYASMADAIKSGVTTMIDMHECGSDPRATLLAIAGAASDIGMRTCLSFGAGANGKSSLDAEIRENKGFIQYCAARPEQITRAFFGIDGIHLLDDEDLWRCAVAAENRAGILISVDDGVLEYYDSIRRYSKSPVERLRQLGLLNDRTVVCHCGCIGADDMETLSESGASAVAVPCADGISVREHEALRELLLRGMIPAVGCDGSSASPLRAVRHAALRLNAEGPLYMFDGGLLDVNTSAMRMLFVGGAIATRAFEKTIGSIEPGAAADIIIMDLPVFTDADLESAVSHLLYGEPRCIFSMINGRVVMRDGELKSVREEFLIRRCASAFAGLKQRLDNNE